jgi:hypothetical protein
MSIKFRSTTPSNSSRALASGIFDWLYQHNTVAGAAPPPPEDFC